MKRMIERRIWNKVLSWHSIVYKMPKNIQNTMLRYIIQNIKSISNKHTEQRTTRNWQRTKSNKSRGSSKVYLTIHTSIQQEEVQKVTRMTEIRL